MFNCINDVFKEHSKSFLFGVIMGVFFFFFRKIENRIKSARSVCYGLVAK